MIIYSESIHVEHKIEKSWLEWMDETIIPMLKETGLKIIFSKIVSHTDETGNTYSLQFHINSSKDQEIYKKLSHKLFLLTTQKYVQQVIFFRTELAVLYSK